MDYRPCRVNGLLSMVYGSLGFDIDLSDASWHQWHMGFNCGIIGLPNVGKSTLFNAMTAQHVPAENYPFCTTDHHVGMVNVPDARLTKIAEIFNPERVVNTKVEFVDIAGLVENAHKGEGLGNRFLAYIREVDAIAHLVRCFEAPQVSHPYEKIDPIHDIQIINTELMLADLETVNKRYEKLMPQAKSGDKDAKKVMQLLEKIKISLEGGRPIRLLNLSAEELIITNNFFLLTDKPILYVCNVNETDIKQPSDLVKKVNALAQKENSQSISICGSIEGELADLSEAEQKDFLEDLGLHESGLDRLIHAGYQLLDLVTFFTKDGPEVKAWTVKKGTKAPQAAGKIHTDFERGFIKADVYSYEDLIQAGSEHALKESSKFRTEGHDYIIQDGDIIHFKFNV